ncbi:hypothetical protein X798_00855 [Onchocerca flexuosa]|uniref:C-type lectin domain-containing protein n=1 Tax=Onchocerca flexuosa TaxID=387005 RepID=A0A238C4D3_9BILA|nr:hypothetical protein X798_00855 [Onchocerca flexuosa]
MDAFVPYLRVDDSRQKQLAKRIDDILHMRTGDNTDRYNTFTVFHSYFLAKGAYDKQVWISGVTIPLTQCGWLNTRTGNIGTQNCNNLLSFVCEKAVCWYRKSRKRKEEEVSRKECIRASLRLSKLANELKKNNGGGRIAANVKPLINRTEQLTTKGEDTLCLAPKTFDSRPRSTRNKLVDLPPPPLFDRKLLEKIPTISSPPRRSLYETTTELVRNGPHSNSSSYRTKIRPLISTPNPPDHECIRNPQSSQSLVDLITPSVHYQRSNSTGKALPIETSM